MRVLIDDVCRVLRVDQTLMELMGKASAKNQRIYCTRAANAEEFPRGIIDELDERYDVHADDDSGFVDCLIRVTYYSRSRNVSALVRQTEQVIRAAYPLCGVTVESERYEADNNVFAKAIKIQIYIESEE